MAQTLLGSTSMPLLDTMNPINFIENTLNTKLLGFILILYSSSLSKTLLS